MLADLLKLQVDVLGAQGELAAALLSDGMLRAIAPVSDQPVPVITVPGFLASETSMSRLNRFLNNRGFNARSWGLGRNLGPQGTSWGAHMDHVVAQLGDRIRALADEASAPVALVGQSLGGVYARELALRLEGDIDRVIMLGAPTFHPYKTNRHNRLIASFGYWLNRQTATEFAGRDGMLHWEADRPDLPCVAIHSPIDGIVDEDACHIPGYIVSASGGHSPRENIRVISSHIGMCVNPLVLLAVADRLLADRNDWQPFDPRAYFPGFIGTTMQMFYPDASALVNARSTRAFLERNR